MREIKFRVWDGSIMRHHWDGWSEVTDILEEVWLIASEDYKYSIMQYTGLKDKKGVEIYEGDILLNEGSVERGDGYSDDDLQKVEFVNGAFYGIGENDELLEYLAPETLVVGNIYENLELLND